jgi:hypothetical protein
LPKLLQPHANVETVDILWQYSIAQRLKEFLALRDGLENRTYVRRLSRSAFSSEIPVDNLPG